MNVQTAKVLKDFEMRFLEDKDAVEASVDCQGCSAPCCRLRHVDAIPLSFEESQRLPAVFRDIQIHGKTVSNVATLPRHPVTGECVFVRDGTCSIWNMRPKTCRVYDCRKDDDAVMVAFVAERFK